MTNWSVLGSLGELRFLWVFSALHKAKHGLWFSCFDPLDSNPNCPFSCPFPCIKPLLRKSVNYLGLHTKPKKFSFKLPPTIFLFFSSSFRATETPPPSSLLLQIPQDKALETLHVSLGVLPSHSSSTKSSSTRTVISFKLSSF